MAIVTLGELLDRGAEFETRQESFYARVRDGSADNGVRLLTYYLAKHRRHQAEATGDADPALIKRVRKVELKLDVNIATVPTALSQGVTPETVTGDQLLETAIGYDAEMIAMYKAIAAQPIGEEARAFVESLIRLEERDIVMMKKMLAMHYF
jgi:hypothetical protein